MSKSSDWIDVEKKYYAQTVRRQPVVLVKGEGTRAWDADGKEYLDFVAGWAVNQLGHCHPTVTKAIADQASGDEVCQAANDNSVGQVVVSGHKGAVEAAVALATERGAKKAVTLPVSAPFHCSLMAPAAQKMATALADTNIRPPCVPVVANVTAQAVTEPADIRSLLIDQITGAVRWRESVIWMKENGVSEAVELGAGKVLAGLVKRIDRDIATSSVGTPEQIEELITNLRG